MAVLPPAPLGSLGDQLCRLRRTARMSQAAVGAIVGVEQATLSRWERNDGAPSPTQIQSFFSAVDASAEERAAIYSIYVGEPVVIRDP